MRDCHQCRFLRILWRIMRYRSGWEIIGGGSISSKQRGSLLIIAIIIELLRIVSSWTSTPKETISLRPNTQKYKEKIVFSSKKSPNAIKNRQDPLLLQTPENSNPSPITRSGPLITPSENNKSSRFKDKM